MRKWLIILILMFVVAVPAQAADYTAPEPPEDVQQLLPYESMSFGEGLWHVITSGFSAVYPNLSQCVRLCFSVTAIVLLLTLLQGFPGSAAYAVELSGCIAIACILLMPADTLVKEAAETIQDLALYGKLLLPVMTASLAAQGGAGTAAALYAGTAAFNAVLGTLVSNILVPMVYIFLALSVVNAAAQADILEKARHLIMGFAAKGLRTVLYVFTGYLTVTGVIGGATDQMTVRAAKLTIAGMVPVVGNIMADASEAILLSAGMVKGTVGVYGLWSALAIGIGPFLNIGLQYLALKATTAICSMFGNKKCCGLIGDFAAVMGLLLAMTGTMCLLLLISTVCFMKGFNG